MLRFLKWFRTSCPAARTPQRRPRAASLYVEPLEGRALLSTITFDTLPEGTVVSSHYRHVDGGMLTRSPGEQPKTVTAVVAPNDYLHLFKVGPGGGIYSTRWDVQWHDGFRIGRLVAPPESVFTAAADSRGNLNVFVVDPNGGLSSSDPMPGFANLWVPPVSVYTAAPSPESNIPPPPPVSLEGELAGMVDVRTLVDMNSSVYWDGQDRGEEGQWTGWIRVHGVSVMPLRVIAAIRDPAAI